MIGKHRGLFSWGPDGEIDLLDPNHHDPTEQDLGHLVVEAFGRAAENGSGTE